MTVRASSYSAVVTWEVEVPGARIAYRRLGAQQGVPVVFLNHWGANLHKFHPRIVDGLAADRPVYAFNYRGIGGSSGDAPFTVAAMAGDVIAAIHALTQERVDLIGFSLGGFVAQEILLAALDLVRRAILAGSGPAGGAGIEQVGAVSLPLILKGLGTLRDPKIYLFFTSSKAGRSAAKAFLPGLKERCKDRDKPVPPGAFMRQLRAIKAWGRQPTQPLETIRKPVLVTNGEHDIMVPTSNSRDLVSRVPGAELVLYPDAGHGGIFQYREAFFAKTKVCRSA